MSKQFKLKAISLAEDMIQEMDKLDSNESKKILVGWMLNFWSITSHDLGAYASVKEDIKDMIHKGILNKLNKAKELV
jgi:hypothetical protein